MIGVASGRCSATEYLESFSVVPDFSDLVAQVHAIKRRVLPSGKASFDADRSARGGLVDRFWAIALACQKERGAAPSRGVEIEAWILG